MTRFLLALLLLLFLAPAVGAAAPVVSVQAEAGFGGRAKAGRWAPVVVTIQNDGAELEGIIRFEVEARMGDGGPMKHTGLYDTPVIVPAGAVKSIEVAVPVDPGMGTPSLWLVAGGEAVSEIAVALEVTDDLLVGVLGAGPAELAGLAGKAVGGRPVRLVQLDPERLPADPLLLESLDAVLLDRFAYGELPEQRRQTLQNWVEQGGTLILAAGPEAKRLEGLAPWISLPLKGLQTVRLDGIGTVPLSLAEPGGGWQVEQQAGGQILALRQSRGMGSVHLLTFDPSLEPFASWRGLPGLFTPIFPPADPIGPKASPKAQYVLMDTLSQFPVRELPSVKPLLMLLGLYALVAGPVHFLLLRGARRLRWAVLTLPLVVLAGGAGIWAYTEDAHASDLLVSSIAVVEGQSGGGSMRVNLLAGIFVPPGSRHRIEAEGALLSPLPPVFTYRPDGQGEAADLQTTFERGRTALLGAQDGWGMQAVSAEAVVPAPGAVSGELAFDKNFMKGRLTSHLPFALEGAVVASGTNFLPLGDFDPGETIGVEMMAPAFAQEFETDNRLVEILQRANQFIPAGPQPTAAEQEMMRRQQVAWAATTVMSWARSGYQPPAFVAGWARESVLPLTADGRPVQTGGTVLYVQPLPLGIAGGEFALPASLISGRAVGDSQGRTVHSGWSLVLGESITLEFDLPSQVLGRWTELDVKVPTFAAAAGGKHPLEYSLYRWSDSTWHRSEYGRPVTDPAFVSAAGTVRVKVTQAVADPIPLGRPGLAVRGRVGKP